jgi:site-specific recombinase XerD
MLPEITQFGKWLRRKNPQASTHLDYTKDLRLFFTWASKPPDAITPRDVDAYIEHCLEKNLATATINRRLWAIHGLYRFLGTHADVGDVPSNPILLEYHLLRSGRQLPRDARDEDVARLFAQIEKPRDRAMYLLMLRCGLRVGEVQALSLSDLYLHPAYGGPSTRSGRALPRLWLNGKRSKQRVVYISHQALDALNTWLEVRPQVETGAVFVNRFGDRIARNGIEVLLGRYCCKAGVWITCHELRHCFGRHMTDAGMPVTSTQRLLGHARLSTTQLYLHVSDPKVQGDYEDAIEQVIERLSLEDGAE